MAAKLGIPFVTFDFEEDYRRTVVEYLFAEYQAGRTPNPDVMCNRFMKFDRFVRAADELGCACVATGHYATVTETTYGGVKQWTMQRAIDENKDQTYFLWAIQKDVLSRVLFPIGNLTKPEVRAKATECELSVANKKDSTGICFVGEVNMAEFLKTRLHTQPGEVVTTDGHVVGTHQGDQLYTIGQRHGIGVGGGIPYYVLEKDLKKNQLVVSSQFHPKLYSSRLCISQVNFLVQPESIASPLRCHARIRHRQPLQSCQVSFQDMPALVEFDQPQRAVTPGQSIVFYDGSVVVGGGIIDSNT